ncbi:uncharacterized protein LOC130714677 [Lotus japonicus]|uniref:uncharacterized protein LOC130714677 n=1 Tax=Lotus japonicus TaxID=34305 RepID=UPI00258B3161|nr:uncharacterized protein LOC130714677 [Lotus japonicus]
MLDVWDMQVGDFIIVNLDKYGRPVGEEATTLTRFIGSVVRRPHFAPINYISWKKMPKENIDDMLEAIESKFEFVPPINDTIREMLKAELNEKWRQWKSDIKSLAYNPSKTEEEIASKLPDDRVEPSQYRDLVHHWFSESGQKTSEINRRNRAKFEDVHCMGTKSLPRLIDEKEELKKHDEAETSQSTQNTQRHTSWKEDIFSKVQGLDKRGRIRCMGKIPKCKKTKASSSENEELRDRMKHMENLLVNVLTLIQNRLPGEDLNELVDAARRVSDASSAPNHLNSPSSNANEDDEYDEDGED